MLKEKLHLLDQGKKGIALGQLLKLILAVLGLALVAGLLFSPLYDQATHGMDLISEQLTP